MTNPKVKDQLKIAFFSFPLLQKNGGVATSVLELSDQLRKLKYNVKNFEFGYGWDTEIEPKNNHYLYKSSSENLLGVIRLTQIFKLIDDLRVYRPNIIFANQIYNLSTLIAWLYSMLFRRNLFIISHGSFATRHRNRFMKSIANLLFVYPMFLKCKAIVVTSELEKSTIPNHFKRKTEIVELGISIFSGSAITPIQKKQKKFLFLGRFDPIKRIDLILHAVAILKRKGISTKVTLAGYASNEYANNLVTLATDLNIRDQIEFLPWVHSSQKENLFNQHAFLIHASDFESFGLSIVEGLTFGLIPVVSNQIPIKEFMLRHNIGEIVPSQDPLYYAQAVEKILNLDLERESNRIMKIASTDFQWSSVIGKWVSLINQTSSI